MSRRKQAKPRSVKGKCFDILFYGETGDKLTSRRKTNKNISWHHLANTVKFKDLNIVTV